MTIEHKREALRNSFYAEARDHNSDFLSSLIYQFVAGMTDDQVREEYIEAGLGDQEDDW